MVRLTNQSNMTVAVNMSVCFINIILISAHEFILDNTAGPRSAIGRAPDS